MCHARRRSERVGAVPARAPGRRRFDVLRAAAEHLSHLRTCKRDAAAALLTCEVATPIIRGMNDALRVSVEPVILALLGQQPDHGYSLMLRIRATMDVDLSDGSLYPALKRLEESGRIEGTWEKPEGERRRRVYHLTDDGRSMLRKARAYWPELAERLGRLLAPTNEPKEAPVK